MAYGNVGVVVEISEVFELPTTPALFYSASNSMARFYIKNYFSLT
jgi:hypothetical protein